MQFYRSGSDGCRLVNGLLFSNEWFVILKVYHRGSPPLPFFFEYFTVWIKRRRSYDNSVGEWLCLRRQLPFSGS